MRLRLCSLGSGWGQLAGALSWSILLMFAACSKNGESNFARYTNAGKNYYDKGEAEKAVQSFEQALAANPSQPDAKLNLANALLLANQPSNALYYAQEVLVTDPNSAAAYYVSGSASLRLGQ